MTIQDGAFPLPEATLKGIKVVVVVFVMNVVIVMVVIFVTVFVIVMVVALLLLLLLLLLLSLSLTCILWTFYGLDYQATLERSRLAADAQVTSNGVVSGHS